MIELVAKFPEPEVLLGLEPEELGAEILFLLKQRDENAMFKLDGFNPNSLRCELYPHSQAKKYPEQYTDEVLLAVAEAFG